MTLPSPTPAVAADSGRTMLDPIAIVGLSGRYPKAPDLDTLWRNLIGRVDAVGEADGSRWDLGHHVAGTSNGTRIYTKAGGFLDRIDAFDADFFGITPREAKQIDPQHRLLLELAWEAFESAGIVPATLSGSATGVFVGISGNDYANLAQDEVPDAYTNIGSALSIAANRISYVFDFHGPSMAIDTACSSSMVAIHQACRALASGEAETTLAGGINILASHRPFIGFARASMLSPDGRCKSFDADGKGYVRAEGGGLILLKRLADAERDGDPILAVIRATGVNSDGRTMGMALPNGAAQEALLRQVYGESGVAADDVFYVEAHGTGTAAGDPIECGAIGRVLGTPRTETGDVCRIGSIKSNIGHLESGAGIAGLTKVLLSIRHRALPGNLHFDTPNPKIAFDQWKLQVVDAVTPLPDRAAPLRFGVNSFGFGGTNAHLILEEYRGATTPAATLPAAPVWNPLLILSGQSPAALDAQAEAFIAQLDGIDTAEWDRIKAGAARLRALHAHRLVLWAESAADARAQLIAFRAGEAPALSSAVRGRGLAAAGAAPIAFVFSGNGPQWWGMGRELLAECPPFRAAIEEVDAIFAPLSGWSLVERMARDEADTDIALTEIAQPMLFAQQVALCRVLGLAGIAPAAVFGHSVGEAAAAWASGALSLEQATTVIYHRSQQQATTRGAGKMAAIGLSPAEAEREIADIPGWIEIAAVNSPRAVTVAGDEAALKTLEARLTERDKFVRILALDYAFHTRAMDPIEAPLRTALAGLAPATTRVPMVSTVTGAVIDGETLDADYWWRNIRCPVAFDAAARAAIEDMGITTLIEVGPHPVLKDYVLQVAKAAGIAGVDARTTLRRPSERKPAPELATLQTAITGVYAAGAGDVATLFPHVDRTLTLPTVAWQRQRHWRGGAEMPDAVPVTTRDHALLGARSRTAEGLWTNAIQPTLQPHLRDHVIQDAAVFPAAGYIEISLAAGRLTMGSDRIDVETFEILRPLVLPADSEPVIETTLDATDGTIVIRSRSDVFATDYTVHCKGRLSKMDGAQPGPIDLAALRADLPVSIAAADHYAGCDRRGLRYGSTFQGVRSIALTAPDAATRVALGEVALDWLGDTDLADNHSHPAIVDGCLQVLITLIGQNDARACATIPVQVDRVRSFAPIPARVFCRVTLRRESERSGIADIDVTDADGTILLQLLGARFQKVEFGAVALTRTAEDWRPDLGWTPRLSGPIALPALGTLVGSIAADAIDPALAAGIDRLIGGHAVAALRALDDTADDFTIAGLALSGEVEDDQRPLLRALVAMAQADGALTPNDATGRFGWNADNDAIDTRATLRTLMLDHPDWVAELVAISRAGAGLVARLSGEPDAGIAMVEALEDGAPSRAAANRAAADVLRRVVAAWPADRGIRVLEIGGGTGGLTAALLPVLPPQRSDYLFTDPSEALVARAQYRFGGEMHFRAVVQDEALLADRGFDVVVAGAAEDPAALAGYLAPGGVLIALHPHANRLTNLLYGPVEGGPARDADPLPFSAQQVVAEVSPFGPDLIVARRGSDAEVVVPAVPADTRRRTLIVTAAEVGTPFLDALVAALDQPSVRVVDPATLDDAAMAALVAEEHPDEFVHLAGWAHRADAADLDAMLGYQDGRAFSLIALVKAIETHIADHPEDIDFQPQLRIVTRGALGGVATGPIDPFQATAAGIGRVMANEVGSLQCRLIDVHAEPDDVAAAQDVARALLTTGDEPEVQLVDGMRYVARVRETGHAEQARLAPSSTPVAAYRLDTQAQGGLDSLHLREIVRRAPDAGEVEIRIAAAGLNFRDVLWAMGMLPEEAVEHGFSGATIGMECSGIVERVGDGVGHVAVGDRVVAFASSTFATHVTTAAIGVARLADGIELAAGATIPTTFVTAWYALDHLARLAPGESILIHGAAGGVGLAAIQIAKMKGATVFATAGADDKQRLVRDMGADHVLHSRSLAFADEVMRLTGGKGVDVVLNSLAGEAITKGLQLLRPFGRFLEIGKRDLYANSRIGLRPFRQNLSYFGIDADTLLVERPELGARVFAEVSRHLESGALRPLPHLATPIGRAHEAFRAMQQSRHVGKLVVTIDPAATPPVVPIDGIRLRDDATYVVSGGLGGFGLATAIWLAERGAKHLALFSRRGDATEEAQAGIATLSNLGVTVKPIALDVTDGVAVDAAFAAIRADMPPIRGIVHAAAVIEDAPIILIDRDLMNRVMAAKMQGAWNLHRASLADPIEQFVLYSSSSAVVGNPGQAAYVGANLFLDALAQMRRAAGLPALSIGWGAIKGAGFLTRNAQVEEMLSSRAGMGATPYPVALEDLGRMLAVDATRVAVAQFNLLRLGQSLALARTPRFERLVPQGINVAMAGGGSMAGVLEAAGEDERFDLLMTIVREQVARVVGSTAAQIEPDRALAELGLDSLMAVELAESLEQEIGRPVSVMQMIQAGTVLGVVNVAMRSIRARGPAADGTAAAALADAA